MITFLTWKKNFICQSKFKSFKGEKRSTLVPKLTHWPILPLYLSADLLFKNKICARLLSIEEPIMRTLINLTPILSRNIIFDIFIGRYSCGIYTKENLKTDILGQINTLPCHIYLWHFETDKGPKMENWWARIANWPLRTPA